MLIDYLFAPVKYNVWDLLSAAYRRMAHIPPTLLERDFNFPAFAELSAEVQKIADIQAAAAIKEQPHAA